MSHSQVMSVFLQCHVSAPNQCSNTGSVFTHILCYINRSRWAVLAAIYCLCHLTIIRGYWFYFLLLHTHTEIRLFLHKCFCIPTFTKSDNAEVTMPNPQRLQKHTEKVSSVGKDSPQTPSRDLSKAQSHCSQGTLEERKYRLV